MARGGNGGARRRARSSVAALGFAAGRRAWPSSRRPSPPPPLPGDANGRIAFANSGIGTVNPDGHGRAVAHLRRRRHRAGVVARRHAHRVRVDLAGNTDVWVMDADGSNPVDLTDGSAADRHRTDLVARRHPPRVPDRSRRQRRDLRDGRRRRRPDQPLDDPGDDSQPAWSPDGDTIAFVSDRDGNEEVYTMDASDGSSQTDLTNDAAVDRAPDWSPDGARIAFQSDRDGPPTSSR